MIRWAMIVGLALALGRTLWELGEALGELETERAFTDALQLRINTVMERLREEV